jgi:broad specificity phosphatase PhoE
MDKDPPDKTTFGLIRHAQTDWNALKRIQGQFDTALSPRGREQVEIWVRRLQQVAFDGILTSDLTRAIQTAEILNCRLRLPIYQDSRLREQDWGCWVGQTIKGLGQETPLELARQVAAGWKFRPPGGEDRLEVFQRSSGALADWAEKLKGMSVLVVTHEGVIKCLVYRLCGRRFLPVEAPLIRARHLHWLAHDGRTLSLDAINSLNLTDG